MTYLGWYDSKDEFRDEMEREIDRYDNDVDYEPSFCLVCPGCGWKNRMPSALFRALNSSEPSSSIQFQQRIWHLRSRLRCTECQGSGPFRTDIVRASRSGDNAYGWPALSPVIAMLKDAETAPLFHRISCSIGELIPSDAIVALGDRNVALEEGYVACAKCRP